MSTKDVALLRRFEPVIRYTRGERFFPMDAELCMKFFSLWVQRPNEEAACLVPSGELTLERLAQPCPGEFGAVHFLKLTPDVSLVELAADSLRQTFSSQDSLEAFRAGRGRLARVGYLSRFVDALFSIALLARGRVPGGTAAAAARAYKSALAEDECYCYHGRVVRQNGWIVLQYWLFYYFNDWRSGFFGVNDHEADWEMVSVYLSESETGEVKPEWATYSAHYYPGDDLRRRWDDPELEKVGEHPVVYVAAGSHASYYTAGEYLTELPMPFLEPLTRVTDRIQKFWHERLRQYVGEGDGPEREESNLLAVPFVEYVRGDGLTIGPAYKEEWGLKPEQKKEWAAPRLLSPPPAWATEYRGMWGLYTQDPLGGENAPGGPMYNHDGSVRRAWYDPVGWAGLDKVTPSGEALEAVMEQQTEVEARQAELETSVEEKSRQLQGLGVEAEAMRGQPHLGKMYEAHRQRIKELSQEVNQMRAQIARGQTLLESLERYADQLRAGERGAARAHIQHAHRPTPDDELRTNRLAEFWAAVSIGVMLIGFVGLFLFARGYLIWGLVWMVSLFAFIESGFRGRLAALTTSVAIGLSVVAVLVLIYEFFWPIVSLAVFVTGGYILLENLRELWA